ncbi:MAG: hypothetical protein U0559_00285 [Anaerolineae bacterium]
MADPDLRLAQRHWRQATPAAVEISLRLLRPLPVSVTTIWSFGAGAAILIPTSSSARYVVRSVRRRRVERFRLSQPRFRQTVSRPAIAVDPAARQKIIWQMQEMIFKDKPYIILYNYDSLQAYRSDRFKDFIESPYHPIESKYSMLQVEPVR